MSTEPTGTQTGSDPLAPMGEPPAKRGGAGKGGGPLAKENRRALAGAIIGAIVAVFAVLNLDEVEVNWIVGSGSTPLILVIAVSFALGAGFGWALSLARRKRKA
jgi:uncharacterized integral membrane protein